MINCFYSISFLLIRSLSFSWILELVAKIFFFKGKFVSSSKKLTKPTINEKWILITSAFHMHRSIDTAAKSKWELTPYPVDFKLSKDLLSEIIKFDILSNIENFQIASHEMLGIMVYKIMGRSL